MSNIFSESIRGWNSHRIQILAAAIAFYALLSLGPLLVMTLSLAGKILGANTASHHAIEQFSYYVGHDGASTLSKIIGGAAGMKNHLMTTTMGIVLIVLGGSAVFNCIHEALNIIWEVPRGKRGGVFSFIRGHIISVMLAVVVVTLFLTSLIASTVLALIGRFMSRMISIPLPVLQTTDFVVSVTVFTFLFAFVFRIVPDAKIRWNEVKSGAFITSVLFNVGKFLISQFLCRNSIVLSYGAAASFIAFILWVYFSAQIFLFGAELTRAHVLRVQKSNKKRGRRHNQHIIVR